MFTAFSFICAVFGPNWKEAKGGVTVTQVRALLIKRFECEACVMATVLIKLRIPKAFNVALLECLLTLIIFTGPCENATFQS